MLGAGVVNLCSPSPVEYGISEKATVQLSYSTPVYVSPKRCLALCPFFFFSWRDRGPLAPFLSLGGSLGVLLVPGSSLLVWAWLGGCLSGPPTPYVSGGIIKRKLFGERMTLLAGHQDFPPTPKLMKWVALGLREA